MSRRPTTAAQLRLFVNGSQVGTRAVTGAMPNSNGPLQIGGNRVWPEWFQGQIDDVRVYQPRPQRERTADRHGNMRWSAAVRRRRPRRRLPATPPASTQAPSARPRACRSAASRRPAVTLELECLDRQRRRPSGYDAYRNGTCDRIDRGRHPDVRVRWPGVRHELHARRRRMWMLPGTGPVVLRSRARPARAKNRKNRRLTSAAVLSTPPGSGVANVWVDANGGSCVRRATAAAYVNAEACGTFDQAWGTATAAGVTCAGERRDLRTASR